jgi:hypothetical protein
LKQASAPREAEHFWKCKSCGGYFDMRDLGAVLEHEEPLPHPVEDQVQERRRIISAASSCVGAMRRGHRTCEVQGRITRPR